MESITVVGSGLAGALMSCYLAQAGHAVELFEKRPDPRGHDQVRGRSINLALSVRGLHALGEVGLADEVLQSAIAMPGRMIHPIHGQPVFQPYGKTAQNAIHSVSRNGLNVALVNAALRSPNVRIHFHHKCNGVDFTARQVHFVDESTQNTVTVPYQTLLAADGAFSAVRGQMQRLDRFNYSQEYQSHGYKELSIPPGPDGTFLLEKHALHIWPRRSFMLIALPNSDGSFTCTLFAPFEGDNSFAQLNSPAAIRRFWEQQFPDAVPLMAGLVEDFEKNPTGPLVTIRCQPWHVGDSAVLIGDACHAVVPFLGQGMNAAFEDCSTLAHLMKQFPHDRGRVFAEYERARKPHVDALAELAVLNFLEMRDKVGSRLFLWKKKIEIALHRLLGDAYVPLYTLISFTRTPYADAREQAQRQNGRVVLGLALFIVALLLILLWLIQLWT